MIQLIQSGHATVVIPEGDLGRGAEAELQGTVEHLLARGNSWIVVDLGHVSHVDSAAWSVFAQAAKQARQTGGELRLCTMSEEVVAAFTMIRLGQIIPVYPTRERALLCEPGATTLRGRSPFRRAAEAREPDPARARGGTAGGFGRQER